MDAEQATIDYISRGEQILSEVRKGPQADYALMRKLNGQARQLKKDYGLDIEDLGGIALRRWEKRHAKTKGLHIPG